jgi:hypothetical protein
MRAQPLHGQGWYRAFGRNVLSEANQKSLAQAGLKS